jgi:ectoine hydroxylase-related dioxygenase (phytanoyl-CoA dioxygenase family)
VTWGLPMGMEGRISSEQPAPASMSDDSTRTTRKDAEVSTGTAQFAAFNAAVEQVNQSQPVEIYGSAGDLLLWHSRLVHAAPPNLGTEPISLRPNVIYDYYALPAGGLEDTPAAEIARGDPAGIWDEWSDELRTTKPVSAGGPRL